MPNQLRLRPSSSVFILLLVCQVLWCSCTRASGAAYRATKLQLPPLWAFYDASDLSQDGRAGGYIRVSNDVSPIDVPIVWDRGGVPAILPVLNEFRKSYVLGFGSDGRALGNFVVDSNDNGSPASWTSAGMTPLPHFGVGGAAFAANDTIIAGETGDANLTNFVPRATLWDIATGSPQLVTGLPDLGTRINSINSSGVYVGTSFVYSGPQFGRLGAFYGRDGTAAVMNYPGFNITRAGDINDSNWMVGTHRPAGATVDRAYMAKAFSEEIYDLGLLAGFPGASAQAINAEGTIVGSALAGTNVRALIWPAGATEPIDFNTLVNLPGETLVQCQDINNSGQILARGFNGYYIFTPIPEPAGLATLFAVGGALKRRARMKTQLMH